MTTKKIFKNDVGILFRAYAGIDLSDATSIVFSLKKPSGTNVEWTATKASDNNYYAEYSTVANDLNEVGIWKFSIEVVTATASYTGETDKFIVYNQFEDDC